MLKIKAILIALKFFIRTGNRRFGSRVHCFAIGISTRISILALIYIDIKIFKDTYIVSNFENQTEKIEYRIRKIAQFYDECLQLGTSPK